MENITPPKPEEMLKKETPLIAKVILGIFLLGVFLVVVSSYNETQDNMSEHRKTIAEIEKDLDKYQAIVDNSTLKGSDTVKSNEIESVTKAAKVEIVSNKEKASKYGGLSIVGEVVNNGNVDVSFVKIIATYYDEKGDVVDTKFTFAGDTASVGLQPGKKTPFEISRIENIKYASYKLDVSWHD